MSKAGQELRKGIAHHQEGRLDEAWTCYEQVLRSHPREPDALHLSGVIATLRGNYAEAARRIKCAVGLAPGIPLYHINLGTALQELGEHDGEAEAAFRQAITLNPRLPAAHHNLANLLLKQKREEEAIAEYDRAIVCDPGHVNARLALTKLLARRREFTLALQILNGLLGNQPDHREALLLCTEVLFQQGRHRDALALTERVLHYFPDDATAYRWQGTALFRLHQLGKARSAYQSALALEPGQPESTAGLAELLGLFRRPDDGLAVLDEGLRRHPESQHLSTQYLFLLNYSARLTPEQSLAAHRSWNERFTKDIRPLSRHQDWLTADPERRLRVGYVSGDFKSHSVAFFLEPLLAAHDRKRFEIVCYSSSDFRDQVTDRLRQHADLWRPVAELEDDALSERIVADRIDILVDLSGHTAGNRLTAFARKPSPVQITYLGYPASTGVSAIDYRITDARADPVGEGERWNSEKLIRLPDCFHCYRPGQTQDFAPQAPLQTNGMVTFASFNVLSKISAETAAAWASILQAVPDSRLLLKTLGLQEPEAQDELQAAFAVHGIGADRLLLDGRHLSHDEHMQRYRAVDICLDTFPYNGTTSTCDALWMGVPVISLRGDRHVARVGFSLLHAIGASELVADSVDEYVVIATGLARDRERIAAYHASLRHRMRTSPLMDESRFVANLEDAYRQTWRDWCITAQH